MAKEISHDSLDNIINDYANVGKKEFKKNETKEKKKNSFSNKTIILLIVAIVSIIGNAVLGVIVIIQSPKMKFEEKYTKCDSQLEKERDTDTTYRNNIEEMLLKGKSMYEVSNKINFYDNHVVFVVEGLGNYYYTYDCMMKKVNGSFTYWAYNREAAIERGYYEGSCN